MLHEGYKSANFVFTWLQQQSYAGFEWVAHVDEMATNMLLLASGVTLLACCLQALRESYAARAVLAVQNAALQESRERFLQIADQTQEVVWEVDAQGCYRYVSRASTAVFGYTPEEMAGKLFFYELHPAAGREAFRTRCFADMQRRVQFRVDSESGTAQGWPGH